MEYLYYQRRTTKKMTKQDSERKKTYANAVSDRNKPYVDIDTAVKKKIKEAAPRTDFFTKGKLKMLRKYVHKKQMVKELEDRPDHLSLPKVKID